MSKYPDITTQFKERIYKYNDNLKIFKEFCLERIPYF